MRGQRRRAWLWRSAWLACAPSLSRAVTPAEAGTPRRVVSVDWTIAETLLGLGHAPVGMCELAAYRQWVVQPGVPDGIHDLGLRVEPNLELLQQLRPDAIFITPQFDAARRRLERIAPVIRLPLFGVGSDAVHAAILLARDLARRMGGDGAAALERRAQVAVEQARERLRHHRRPFLVVQFIDHRLLRVFDAGSLYHAVLTRAGLRNAWTGSASEWGFRHVGIDQLAMHGEAVLVVVEPLPTNVAPRLDRSPVWRAMPFATQGRVLRLPPVWSFGGLVAAERFATLLAQASGRRRFS